MEYVYESGCLPAENALPGCRSKAPPPAASGGILIIIIALSPVGV